MERLQTNAKQFDSQYLVCSICGSKFTTGEEFSLHLQKSFDLDNDAKEFLSFQFEQSKAEKFDCETTKQDSKKDSDLLFTERKFVCEECGNTYKSKKGLKQHIGKVHLKKNKPSKCQTCGKRFKHKYALKFHVKQVHEEATRVNCERCGKTVYNKYAMARHNKKCKMNK